MSRDCRTTLFTYVKACWNLPKLGAILPTYSLHFLYIWLLEKQGEVINLVLKKQTTFCIPCKEKVNRSDFFLLSAIKNSITLNHRNIWKGSSSWEQSEFYFASGYSFNKKPQSCLIYFQPGESNARQSFCRNSVGVKELGYGTARLRWRTARVHNQAYFAHTHAMAQQTSATWTCGSSSQTSVGISFRRRFRKTQITKEESV